VAPSGRCRRRPLSREEPEFADFLRIEPFFEEREGGVHECRPMSTRPPTKLTPSSLSRKRCSSPSDPGRAIRPPLATTRCQGRPDPPWRAHTVNRAARGKPAVSETWPYVITRPGGIPRITVRSRSSVPPPLARLVFAVPVARCSTTEAVTAFETYRLDGGRRIFGTSADVTVRTAEGSIAPPKWVARSLKRTVRDQGPRRDACRARGPGPSNHDWGRSDLSGVGGGDRPPMPIAG
jgi:hypothetical protein